MATASGMAKYLGRSGSYPVNGMRVNITVTDVKDRWGGIDLQITPMSGSGSVWVRAYNVNLDE